LNQNLHNQLDQGQQFFGLAMQEAIVSCSTKAFGQNMLQDQPQEVFALYGAVTGFAGAAFDVFEGDIAIMIGHDIVFRDDAPVKVPRQVFQSGRTRSGASAVNHPFSWGIWQAESGFGRRFAKAGAKHFGQGEFIEQVLAFFLFPLSFGFIHAAAWYHDMDMRVITQAPVMSMQHCGHTDVGTEILGVQAEVLQRAGSACKKEFINEGLVIPGQESELIGERKGCHEVLYWKELFLLAIQPERGFMVLALWAAAMPTGTGLQHSMTAVAALHEQLADIRRPSSADRIDGAQMTW
jgi:hypothetical protein